MKQNRQYFADILLICFNFAVVMFIFCNSSMDYVSSHHSSNNITNIFVSDSEEQRAVIEILIRKIAHIAEYALLGGSVITLVVYIHNRYSKPVFGFAMFYVLSVSVIDEHIQSFSDRSSSTGDIILDFCGALIGFLLGWLLSKLYQKIKCHYKKKNGIEVD